MQIEKNRTRRSREQIIVIMTEISLCDRNQDSIGPRVAEIYLTDPEKIGRWHSYDSEQKRQHLDEHLEDLRGRRMEDMAKKFFPKYRDVIGKGAIRMILKKGDEYGYLSKEDRDREMRYRNSIDGKFCLEKERKEGKCMFNWPEEKKEEYSRMMKEKFERGFVISGVRYSDEERGVLIRLTQNPEFQHTRKANQGSPNWKKIRDEMNKRFGKNRTMSSVCGYYHNLKRTRSKGRYKEQ